MISSIISRVVILLFGTLYPAYASYKAVKSKNLKDYVKWMMYWIVFALFTCTETFTDIFLSWFPFYYEIKIILVIWLLSPATKGSSILYRKFVHPMLSSKEQEIDDYILKAKEQSYRQVLDLGQKGVTVLMQTAIKGGGGIVNQLKKSYSLSDLSDPSNGNDEADDVLVTDPRLIRRRKKDRSPHRSSSASSASVYFSEVDVVASTGLISGDRVSEVRSVEDISSGYSSGEGLYGAHQPLKLQARDSIAAQRAASLTRSRSSRVTRSSIPKKSSTGSDDSDENEVFETNIVFASDKSKNPPEKPDSSSSETEFFDIPESNDFQLHGKRFSNDNKSSRAFQIGNEVDILTKTYAKTSVQRPDEGNVRRITACENIPSTLNLNLTKLSDALSSLLFPSSKVRIIELSPDLSTSTHNEHKVNMERYNKKPDLTKNLEQLHDPSDRNEDLKSPLLSSPVNKNNVQESTGDKIENNAKLKTVIEQVSPFRGWKYNKKLAPLPPTPKKVTNTEPTIKATLVLQPGLVRNISNSADSINKQIFLNYSPKVKRRTRNKSPSVTSDSGSSPSSKGGSALNKMIHLPKKVAHLDISGKIREKRHSWSEFFHGKKLSDSKVQSKSATNLDVIEENVAPARSGSQVSIKSLSDSPLAHRRLKIIRRYVDSDID